MKLVVNMVMGTMMCAFGEGIELCTQQGLKPEQLLELLDPNPGPSPNPNPNPNPNPSLALALDPSPTPNPNPDQVLDLAAVANPMFKLKGPKMIQGDHAPNFPLQVSKYLSNELCFMRSKLAREPTNQQFVGS